MKRYHFSEMTIQNQDLKDVQFGYTLDLTLRTMQGKYTLKKPSIIELGEKHIFLCNGRVDKQKHAVQDNKPMKQISWLNNDLGDKRLRWPAFLGKCF